MYPHDTASHASRSATSRALRAWKHSAGTSFISKKEVRVKKINAASIFIICNYQFADFDSKGITVAEALKVLGDRGMGKVIHFINHADSRVYNGVCTDCPRSFSKS